MSKESHLLLICMGLITDKNHSMSRSHLISVRNPYIASYSFTKTALIVKQGCLTSLIYCFIVSPQSSFQERLENLPQLICGFRVSDCLLSLYVIPDWLCEAETGTLWGLHHLLQGSLFFQWLKIIFHDSFCMFGLVFSYKTNLGQMKDLGMMDKNLDSWSTSTFSTSLFHFCHFALK